MIAVIPVREGVVPVGAEEAAYLCDVALLVGSSTDDAVASMQGLVPRVLLAELGAFQPGRWARLLAELLAPHDLVVLPASADGRDLAPRLARALDRPLFAGVVEHSPTDATVTMAHSSGLELATFALADRAVLTLQPGARTVRRSADEPVIDSPAIDSPATDSSSELGRSQDAPAGRLLPPDPATMDLSEASRLIAGGAGLDSADSFAVLAEVADTLRASTGGTRVVMDWGWIPFERQIGTTGVTVDPELYLAFGISGAVQHTAGLGNPTHTISVNTDPHCPMMAMSDLAIVADANATLVALRDRLGNSAEDSGSGHGIAGEIS